MKREDDRKRGQYVFSDRRGGRDVISSFRDRGRGFTGENRGRGFTGGNRGKGRVDVFHTTYDPDDSEERVDYDPALPYTDGRSDYEYEYDMDYDGSTLRSNLDWSNLSDTYPREAYDEDRQE